MRSPNSAANCYRNTTTNLHHCLNIWQVSQGIYQNIGLIYINGWLNQI
jgi:hypothetical protein